MANAGEEHLDSTTGDPRKAEIGTPSQHDGSDLQTQWRKEDQEFYVILSYTAV